MYNKGTSYLIIEEKLDRLGKYIDSLEDEVSSLKEEQARLLEENNRLENLYLANR